MINLLPTPSAHIASLLFRYQQTEKMPLQQQLALQQASLQKLVDHAVKTVPYYHNHPVWSNLSHNIAWQDLPILTRQQIQADNASFISRAELTEHGRNLKSTSSGSTGRPISGYSTEYSQRYWRSITIRDHLWSQRNFSGTFAIIRFTPDNKPKYPGARQKGWGDSALQSLFDTGELHFLSSSETIEKQYQWLAEVKPDYLLAYPSSLAELARMQLVQGKLESLQQVSSMGETLSDSTRQLVQQAFGCRIHDMYSSEEIGYMALQCPKHDHYHIMSESCFLEVINDQGQPCKPGEMGKVIVTPLHNYRMPLLRYDLGDHAIPGEPCDCGITLPTLQRIAGRTRNLVTYPNGKKSWPTFGASSLMTLFNKAQFQVVQTSVSSLVLKVVTDSPADKSIEQQAIKVVQNSIGHPFDITIEYVDSIPRRRSGKFEEFHSEL